MKARQLARHPFSTSQDPPITLQYWGDTVGTGWGRPERQCKAPLQTLRNTTQGSRLCGKIETPELVRWKFYKLFPISHKTRSCENKYTHPPKKIKPKGLRPPTVLLASASRAPEGAAQPRRDPELGWGASLLPLTRGREKLQIHFFCLDDGESRLEIDGRLHGARS